MSKELNQPDAGTSDWHEPLNENFTDLERWLRHVYEDGIGREGDPVPGS